MIASVIVIIAWAVAIPIFLAKTGVVMLEVVTRSTAEDPKASAKAVAAGAIGAILQWIKSGVVNIEIPLYGAAGCVIYLLWKVIMYDEN